MYSIYWFKCQSDSNVSRENQIPSLPSPLHPFSFPPPLNLSPLSQLPSSSPTCTYVFHRSACFHAYSGVCALCVCEYSPVWHQVSTLRGSKGPCLFVQRKAPARALRRRSPISSPGNNTPSECLELYTTRISSSLSVVSGSPCLSFFHCTGLETEMDWQIDRDRVQQRSTVVFYPKALCIILCAKARLKNAWWFFFCLFFFFCSCFIF